MFSLSEILICTMKTSQVIFIFTTHLMDMQNFLFQFYICYKSSLYTHTLICSIYKLKHVCLLIGVG